MSKSVEEFVAMSESAQDIHLAHSLYIKRRREALLDALTEQKANTPEVVALLAGVL